MSNYENKNTVKAHGQVNLRVSFEGKEDGHPRITFVGNSITRHEPAPAIGWNHNHGMAASAIERDYVHLVMKSVREKYPDAAFCIVQASVWETSYTCCELDEYFAEAAEFRPDFILCAISANIPQDKFNHADFIREIGALHKYLGGGASPKIIQTSSFFNNEAKTAAIREYLDGVGGDFVYISDLPSDKSNLAIGEYEHEGIQYHPGDRGMQKIAERLLEGLYSYI